MLILKLGDRRPLVLLNITVPCYSNKRLVESYLGTTPSLARGFTQIYRDSDTTQE
jgi:hypothetical protein